MSLQIQPDPMPLVIDPFGTARVSGTRVTLDLVVEAYQQGATPEEIVSQYSTLALADVYQVLGFYLRHRQEVEQYLEEGRSQAEEAKRGHQSRLDPHRIRNQLSARQANRRSEE